MLGWLAGNVARFAATWIAVGTVVASVVALADGDDLEAPNSVSEILSMPFSILAMVLIFMFAAAVGLLLFSPALIPSLAVYLLALWWGGGRAAGHRWGRVLAVALSPVLSFFFIRGGIDSLSLSVLGGAVIYGFVAKPRNGPPRSRTPDRRLSSAGRVGGGTAADG